MNGEDRRGAARALGRRGGLKGGPARAKSLTAAERSDIARAAAISRWGVYSDDTAPESRLDQSSLPENDR